MEIIFKLFVVLAVLAACAHSQTTSGMMMNISTATVSNDNATDGTTNAMQTDEMTTSDEGSGSEPTETTAVMTPTTTMMPTTSGSRKQFPTILAILAAPVFAFLANRF